jgi:hypothetical protein
MDIQEKLKVFDESVAEEDFNSFSKAELVSLVSELSTTLSKAIEVVHRRDLLGDSYFPRLSLKLDTSDIN